MEEKKCTITIVSVSDVKSISENRIVIKRKYGKNFKREIFQFEAIDTSNEKKPIN